MPTAISGCLWRLQALQQGLARAGIAYDDDERDLPDDIHTGMMANRERAEAE